MPSRGWDGHLASARSSAARLRSTHGSAPAASARITDLASEIEAASHLVLPGVGAFADAMAELRLRGFDELVKRYVDTGRPFLGICVGAQLLFEVGEEHGQ